MKQRGRKSAAELAVITPLPGQRYQPPDDLTDAQASVWRQIVAMKPTDFFTPETHPLLKAFCRHVVSADMIAREIDRFPSDVLTNPGSINTYKSLLRLRTAETNTISSLATKMRITQESTIRVENAMTSGSSSAAKPWNAE